MHKVIGFSLAFLITLSLAHSQTRAYLKSNENWYPGTITLTTQETIAGEVNYNFITEKVSIKHNDKTKTLGANNIVAFQLTDNEDVRKFYSLPLVLEKRNYKRNTFYEEVYSNSKIAILCRATVSNKPEPVAPGVQSIGNVERTFEKIYLADTKGKIYEYGHREEKSYNVVALNSHIVPFIALPRFSYKYLKTKYKISDKYALQHLMGNRYSSVDTYIESKKLKVKTIEEMIEVIDYYESLFKKINLGGLD